MVSGLQSGSLIDDERATCWKELHFTDDQGAIISAQSCWCSCENKQTNKHILCKSLYLFWFWWGFSFSFFFSFWFFCCWLFGLSLTSPNAKRKSEYRIAKSMPGLKCQWFQLKVVDAFTELNISKLNCKFKSRSECLAQLKRKPQLSFLFSPSLYPLSDDEFPVAGRGDPQQK